MEYQSDYFKRTQPEDKHNKSTDVIIRSFQSRDSHVVREIFAGSMGELRGPLVRDVMYQAIVYGVSLSLPAALFSVLWCSWFLAYYFLASLVCYFAYLVRCFTHRFLKVYSKLSGHGSGRCGKYLFVSKDVPHVGGGSQWTRHWYGGSCFREWPRRKFRKASGGRWETSEDGCFTRIPSTWSS